MVMCVCVVAVTLVAGKILNSEYGYGLGYTSRLRHKNSLVRVRGSGSRRSLLR